MDFAFRLGNVFGLVYEWTKSLSQIVHVPDIESSKNSVDLCMLLVIKLIIRYECSTIFYFYMLKIKMCAN